MNIDRSVFALAGTLVLASLALGIWVHASFHLVTAFVGLNLLQAAFTRFCPAATLMKRLGVRPGRAFE